MKVKKEGLSCISCGLHEGVASHKILPHGHGKKGILIIGEAPGTVEDRRNLPWQGQSGRLLEKTLAQLGVNLFEDCVSVNAVNCRPPNNRAPKPFEMDCCRAVVLNNIFETFKPKVIILLGSIALQSFMSPRWPSDLGAIAKWRGWCIPDRDYKAFVVPTYHPSYILRIDSREANTVWKQDLEKAVEAVGKPFPRFQEPTIEIIEDLSIFNDAENHIDEMAFDYETTGLKSQGKGHRIVCASVAFNSTKVFAFMMPDTKLERKPFVDLLINPSVGKMAHNMKFEHAWTLNRLKVEVQNWHWDSMIAAHNLDNRSGVTGLKFQTYVNFGVIDYSSEITPYLRSDGGGNGFNKIYELLEQEGGPEKLLKYCALDSHYEYILAQKQMDEMNYNDLPF